MPAKGPDVMRDVVVSPAIGFDPGGYRLGYGGGFYDRTLAATAGKPPVAGVAATMSAIAAIHPLPHDIPVQLIVTEHGCSPGSHGPPGPIMPAAALPRRVVAHETEHPI